MSGNDIGPEVTKGAVIILQAAVIKFHWDPVFASDIAHNIYSTPPIYSFSGSIVRNGKALKVPIIAPLFSDLPSDDIASRKQSNLYRCFHTRNTFAGAYAFHRNIASPLCTGLIDGLALYTGTKIDEAEVADTKESTIGRGKAEDKSGTYDMKRDYDDPAVAVMSQVAHALV